jgi:hypothetical protein
MRKSWFLFLLAGWSLLPVAAQQPEPVKEDMEFVEARKLFWSGQYDEAERLFKIYLAAHPESQPSRSFLQLIDLYRRHVVTGEEESIRQVEETRKRLEGIRVESLQFKDAEWREVLERLEQLSNPKKDGMPPVRRITFINALPSGMSARFSIDLRDVTLFQAIESCCEKAGLRFVTDLWAVIIDLPEGKKR